MSASGSGKFHCKFGSELIHGFPIQLNHVPEHVSLIRVVNFGYKIRVQSAHRFLEPRCCIFFDFYSRGQGLSTFRTTPEPLSSLCEVPKPFFVDHLLLLWPQESIKMIEALSSLAVLRTSYLCNRTEQTLEF